MRRAWWGGLLAVVALTGCLEEDLTVRLEPDGRGTIHLDRKVGKQLSEMVLGFAEMAGGRDAAVKGFAASQLGNLQGIDAWSDVEARVTEDGLLHITATGWFSDLAQVQQSSDSSQSGFTVVREGDTWTVRYGEVMEGAPTGPSGKSPLEMSAEELEAMRGQMAMIGGMLQGFRQQVILELPGEPTAAEGWSERQGTRVSVQRDAAWLQGMLEGMMDRAGELRAEIEAGRLEREAADEQLKEWLTARSRTEVTFVPRARTGQNDFEARYQAAVQAWEGSEWQLAIQEARDKGGQLNLGASDEPPPEGLDRSEPDAFEPNDTQEQAKELKPGRHENLLLVGGEDWYRLTIPADKELKVEVGFDNSVGDIDLELRAKTGEALTSATGYGNFERLRYAPGASATVYLRVYNAANPYHLQVELIDYVPADRFEPNDSPSQAKPIEVGQHGDLVCTGNDYYAIEVPRGQILEVVIEFADGTDLDLKVLDENESQVATSTGWEPRERVACISPGGRLLVGVYNAEGPYTMQVALREGPQPDAFEENDTVHQAKPLQAGRHAGLYCDDNDYYRVQIPAGKRIVARMRPTEGGASIYAQLETAKGDYLEVENRYEDGGPVLFYTPPGGGAATVLLHVHGGLNTYDLEVEFEDPPVLDAFEPNDSREDAKPITPGKHEKLRTAGSEDWYTIELKPGQTLRVQIEFRNGRGDLDLEVQSEDGNSLASSAGVEDREEVVVRSRAGGLHVIKVYLSENDYTMTVAVE